MFGSRCVSLAVVLLLAQSVAGAAGKGGKVSPAKAPSVPVAASVAEPAPASVVLPPFSPLVFREGDDVRAWLANNPKKVYEWIGERIAKVPNKVDQFSTREERRAYESAVFDAVASVGQLPFVFPCSKKYNPDAQAFEIGVAFFGIRDRDVMANGLAGLRLRELRIGSESLSVSTYTAQNAYGASIEVTKSEADHYSIAVSDGISHGPAELQPGAFGSPRDADPESLITYRVPLPMPSADARAADAGLACAAVITLLPPFITEYDRVMTPTRDIPAAYHFKVHAFVAHVDRFMVVNKATGQVYLEFKRQ